MTSNRFIFLKLHWCLNNRCLDIKSNEENAANNYKSLLECKSRSTRMKICSVGLYTISIKQLSLMFFMQVSIPKLLKIIKIVFKTNNESTEHCKEKKCLQFPAMIAIFIVCMKYKKLLFHFFCYYLHLLQLLLKKQISVYVDQHVLRTEQKMLPFIFRLHGV